MMWRSILQSSVLVLFISQISANSYITLYSSSIEDIPDSKCQVHVEDVLWAIGVSSNTSSDCMVLQFPDLDTIFHVCVNDEECKLSITTASSEYIEPTETDFSLCMDMDNFNRKYDALVFTNISCHIDSSTRIAHYVSIEFHKCEFAISANTLEFERIQNLSFSGPNFLSFSISTSTRVAFINIENLSLWDCTISYDYFLEVKDSSPMCSPQLDLKFNNCKKASFFNFIVYVFRYAMNSKDEMLKFDDKYIFSFNNTKIISFINSQLLPYGVLLVEGCKQLQFDNCEVNGPCRIRNSDEPLVQTKIEILNSQFTYEKGAKALSNLIDLYSVNTMMNIVNTTFRDCDCENVLLYYLAFKVSLENVTFLNNKAIPIYSAQIDKGLVMRLLNVDFIDNIGSKSAGAIYVEAGKNIFLQLSNVWIRSKWKQLPNDDSGGDIIIWCNTESFDFKITATNVTFETTHSNYGIYITISHSSGSDDGCSPSFSRYFEGISMNYLRTSARKIQSQEFKNVDMYSGKSIHFPNLKVTDCFGNNARCNAAPTLVYNNTAENCTIDINRHDELISLETRKYLTTELYLTSVPVCHLPTNVTLMFKCADVTTAVNLTLRKCPLGYVVSDHTQQVVCEATDDIVSDDSKEHKVCIERDYWYGEMNSTSGHTCMIKSPCGPPYCVNDREACPINGFTETHQILPWTQDEQCNGYYGGVLCRSCREQAVFTFGASKCIPLSECKQCQPYLIICLAIVGQIVLTLVMICSRAKTTVGVGYLYGPLFFIAVYKLLPISNKYFLLTSPLEITFSFYESILLLDLDILGKVNWCFFNLDEAIHYSMRFIGPLITFLVLLLVVLIAKNSFCYKFRINRIIQSPIQPMCLLIMLSFWSLSKTSIEIIKPIIINDELRFSIQPEYAYLGNGYIIGLFCISVVLLTIFYLPFIFLLLSSQFIRRKINLFRIQPFLDAFQSTYKDNCQWFSGVYLLSWLILNTELPPYAFIIVSFSISAIHFTVQPHKSTFLNVADSLLVVDMLILSSLSYFSNEHHTIMVIKYPLLIIPLMYILMGGVWISIRGTVQKCINKFRYPIKNDGLEMHELMLEVENVIDSGDIDVHENIVPQDIVITRRGEMEREPLIYDD